jgi:hypothetical protein
MSRKSYTKEFKLDAIALVVEQGSFKFKSNPLSFTSSSFGVRFCTIFLVEGSPQLDFRRNLPASDLFGLVTHSRFLLSLSK